jgi:hypothetical protein
MATVEQVADRAFRDYLALGDDAPVTVTFAATVTSSDTVWPFDASMLSPDELDLLAPGVVVEADDGEQALVRVADVDAGTLTVVRGYNGTPKAGHTDGAVVTVAPMYSRRTALEAVKDEVVNLYPSVWRVASYEFTASYDWIAVPADVVTPTGVQVVTNDNRVVPIRFNFMADFPPSHTGKAIVLQEVTEGLTGWLSYRGRFVRPTFDRADLTDFGVDPAWERILAAGAALTVTAGRDLDQLSASYVTEALEREALPAGEARNVRNGLLQLRAVWLEQARQQLAAAQAHPVVTNPVGAF